jgi:hypothetical protein
VRPFGRFDIAFARQPTEGEEHGISGDAKLIGQLPGAWNVATGPQFALGNEQSNLFTDLFVQRAAAPGLDLEGNVKRGWPADCGRGGTLCGSTDGRR